MAPVGYRGGWLYTYWVWHHTPLDQGSGRGFGIPPFRFPYINPVYIQAATDGGLRARRYIVSHPHVMRATDVVRTLRQRFPDLEVLDAPDSAHVDNIDGSKVWSRPPLVALSISNLAAHYISTKPSRPSDLDGENIAPRQEVGQYKEGIASCALMLTPAVHLKLLPADWLA